MLLLSREDIKKVFTMKDAVEADKKAFQLVVEGKCDSPIRTNIQAPKYDGSFLFMPAYVEEMDTASLKVVNIFPHNIDRDRWNNRNCGGRAGRNLCDTASYRSSYRSRI